jgi:anaerobic selenocysteine-containing dehydrogenase
MWKSPIPEIDNSDLFVAIGGNPVRIRTAQAADQWISIRPGGDAR